VKTAVDLPSVTGLSEPQVRGQACVWCGIILDATAIDLGPRPLNRLGAEAQWFPRSCRHCNVEKAYNALLAHVWGCDGCTTDAEAGTDSRSCEEGRVLRAAWREAPRP